MSVSLWYHLIDRRLFRMRTAGCSLFDIVARIVRKWQGISCAAIIQGDRAVSVKPVQLKPETLAKEMKRRKSSVRIIMAQPITWKMDAIVQTVLLRRGTAPALLLQKIAQSLAPKR